MNIQVLTQELHNPQPSTRLTIVRVVGMVEETQLLPRLRERFKLETDPDIRAALDWAGKRLYQAHQRGHSTLNAIFSHFNIDREIENAPDEKEAELMKQMQSNLDRDLLRMQTDAGTKKVGLAAGAALAGGIIGATTAAISTDAASSNLGAGKEFLSGSRIPAPIPATSDIKIWTKRLREDANPDLRKKAAIELGNLNNPSALPYLALSFTADTVADVRNTAERFGKILYWSAVYWQMTQDGTIEQEIAKRWGKGVPRDTSPSAPTASATTTQTMPPVQAPKDDIGEILRRTQEKRRNSSKKR